MKFTIPIYYYYKPYYLIVIFWHRCLFFFFKTALLLIKLLIFLISKLAISIAFCIIYMLTVEIFPTRMRATLLSVCSMIGRIGSMLAPQTTLLVCTIYCITLTIFPKQSQLLTIIELWKVCEHTFIITSNNISYILCIYIR